MEPVRLAAELGISDKTLRAWLRRTYPRHPGDKGSSWSLTPEQVVAARRRWGASKGNGSTPAASPIQLAASRMPDSRITTTVPVPQSRAAAHDDVNAMLARLGAGMLPVAAMTTYSDKPGIYGVFYLGEDFPLVGAGVKKGTLVYVGKTESSQLTRDLKQHLADGKTGHSTLRRTLAALLRVRLGLRPRSRSETEGAERRFKHYKLDDQGERMLTAWMRESLGFGFVPCDCPVSEIRRLEAEMIHAVVPVLNIAGNPTNPYLKQLKANRAQCVALARQFG